ncbi:hypothetical protein GCM10009678_91000 [Actinomadura kijaniata]|uniref:Uncharacterized protein n=1 Tax=Actinomadura namibiensis TaxID=182080 RepID=A0A7W3QN62_ACTNM|nr:hypothetical protein [Actinomadura namibiensis]MBA8952738.1 hypothetical protein [Actinomadura namibiensis]
MGDRARTLTERLEAARWGGEPLPSWPLLFLEHLRVGALWARHLGLRATVFDIPGEVAPGIEADPALVRRVDETLADAYASHYDRRSARWALAMAAVRDEGAALPDLPDPYEPLIMLFERGGSFARDCAGVLWEVGFVGVPCRRYLDGEGVTEPVAPLDHALLDGYDLDRAARDARWPGGQKAVLEALDALRRR